MKKAIFALFTALCISSTAFAELEVEVLDNGFKFTGMVDEDTVIFVYSPDFNPEDLDSMGAGTQFSLLGKIVAEDKFSANTPVNKTIILPDNAVCGDYSVYVKTGETVSQDTASYLNVNAITNFFAKYSDPTADMLTEFLNIANIIGMNLAPYNTHLTPAEQNAIVNALATIDATDTQLALENLKKQFSNSMIIKSLSGTNSTFAAQCFNAYANYADILPAAYYELTAAQIGDVITNILGNGYDSDTIKNKITYYCTVYGANNQPTWKKLKDYVLANSAIFTGAIGFDDSVWNKLIDKLPISEASNISSKLNEIKNNQPIFSSSSGGSGSSDGIATTVINVPKPQVVFADITTEHWAYDAIKSLTDRKIFSGYPDGSFKPSDKILREQAATIFVNAFYLLSEGEATFSDSSPEAWYYPYIASAQKYGFISGYGGKFGVGETITRQDFAVMLYRILSAKGYNFKGSTVEFSDSKLISDYAKEAIEKLSGEKIISGNEGRFAPLDGITRAEAAQMVYSVLK